MSESLDTILAWLYMSVSWLSFGAVWYEYYTLSDKYIKKTPKRRIKNNLPPYEEEGQLYLGFMKDYV